MRGSKGENVARIALMPPKTTRRAAPREALKTPFGARRRACGGRLPGGRGRAPAPRAPALAAALCRRGG